MQGLDDGEPSRAVRRVRCFDARVPWRTSERPSLVQCQHGRDLATGDAPSGLDAVNYCSVVAKAACRGEQRVRLPAPRRAAEHKGASCRWFALSPRRAAFARLKKQRDGLDGIVKANNSHHLLSVARLHALPRVLALVIMVCARIRTTDVREVHDPGIPLG